MRVLMPGILATLLLTSCGDESLERADFNVYFYYPPKKNEDKNKGKEEYIGLVRGLNACQDAAYSKAQSLGMAKSREWTYLCCKKTKKSDCESSHR